MDWLYRSESCAGVSERTLSSSDDGKKEKARSSERWNIVIFHETWNVLTDQIGEGDGFHTGSLGVYAGTKEILALAYHFNASFIRCNDNFY
jgi:hypothetical protein